MYFIFPPWNVIFVLGSTVDYEFTTVGGDIEFSSYFSSHELDDEDDVVVFSSTRVPSDIEPFKGLQIQYYPSVYFFKIIY